MSSHAEDERVFRPGGISYLLIPAVDPARAASFYAAAFGWAIGGDPASPSFADGTGHVIGHFVTDPTVAGAAGVRPYVCVESVDAALDRAQAAGAEVAESPFREGDLWVATLRDPEGNVVGVWQRGPRAGVG